MGGSGGSSGDNTVRYAPYIEAKHSAFLNVSEASGTTARANNPYTSYVDKDFDAAFYGAGYTISSFPSIYDMFGKFMAGVDVEALFEQVLNSVQDTTTIQAAVVAHRNLLDEELDENDLPRFEVGLRDINAVMSSSYNIGRAVLIRGKQYKLAEFDAGLRYKLIPVAAEVFGRHLSWNQVMIQTYLEVMKLAIATDFDTTSMNYDFALKETMWPFTVLEQERANIGAMQGAVSSKAGGETSTAGRVVGGVLGGASLGASVGGAPGAAIGGIIGGLGGLFS